MNRSPRLQSRVEKRQHRLVKAVAAMLMIGLAGVESQADPLLLQTNVLAPNVSADASGMIDGRESTGFLVQSGGSLTMSDVTLQNFTTTGGVGSGGGAGLGGAVFVN